MCGDQGFDEYMNLVLDEAEEVSVKKKTSRKQLGNFPFAFAIMLCDIDDGLLLLNYAPVGPTV